MPALNPNGDVYDLAYHGTGGMLVAGSFTMIGGQSRPYLARFTAAGLDTVFNTNLGTGPDSQISDVLVQPDGRILIAGFFSNVSGVVRKGIARINADGTIDDSFVPPVPSFGFGYSMALQPNGRIVVGGSFNYSGTSNIARLLPNGALDVSFSATLNSTAQSVALQANGKIVVGGNFSNVNGQAGFGALARLNVDGTTDVGFPAAGAFPSTVNTIAIQANGRILVGGNFQSYSGGGNGLVRLETDGSVDASFVSGTGWTAYADVHDIAIRPDGVIWVGGNGYQFNGQTVNYLAAFNGDEPAAETTFASWVTDNMLPPGKDGPLDDADDDGVSNLLEYALGMNPKVSDAHLLPQPQRGGGLLSLTYQRLRSDVTYSAETTTNLSNPASWTISGVDQGTPAPDGTTTASIPISGASGFLHVEVTLNP